jgi:hypothetical protein
MQLSLVRLREQGYLCAITEHRARAQGGTTILKDLFGFVDIIAVRGDVTLAVQATTEGNAMNRVHKIEESDLYEKVRKAWLIEVWGWRKLKPDGKPAGKTDFGRWHCKVREL